MGQGKLPCAIQDLGVVECPIGFARVGGGELCLRRFGGADGTPPLVRVRVRVRFRVRVRVSIPNPNPNQGQGQGFQP